MTTYSCAYCLRTFKTRQHLAMHYWSMRRRTGENRYKPGAHWRSRDNSYLKPFCLESRP